MDDNSQRLCRWRAPLLTVYPLMLASPQTKSSWSRVISSGGEAQEEGEESQTLPPSFLERTPTGFFMKFSGEAYNCLVTVAMVVTDIQRKNSTSQPAVSPSLTDISLPCPPLDPWPTGRL